MPEWTDELIERAYRQMKQGTTAREFAEKEGLTRSAVVGKAQRMWGGWKKDVVWTPPEPTPRNDYTVSIKTIGMSRIDLTERGEIFFRAAWKNANWTIPQIREKVDCSPQVMERWARELKLGRKVYRRFNRGPTKPKPVIDRSWPEGVWFEDDPVEAARPFNRANALKNAIRIVNEARG